MIVALLAAVLALSGTPVEPKVPPASPPPARILVVPFDTAGRDGRTYWLGEAVALVMTDDLNARGLGAISRTARDRAYDQLHLPPQMGLSRATLIKVGELGGAVEVIVGDVRVEGDTLTVRAQPIRIDVGRADGEVVERGPLTDLFAIVQKVSRRVAPGGTEPAAAAAPSLPAFEPFVKGLIAAQPATQASFLEAALKVDPAYHRARLALWEVRNAQGDHAAALAAAKAVPAEAPLARRAQFLAGVSLIALKQYDEAFALLKPLQDAAPDPAVLNNLGVVQLHRPAASDAGKPAYFLTKAAESDPDNADTLFNLGYAYAMDRDPQGAIYWLREALRRNPADADAHVVLAAALDAAGNGVEASRERELAEQLSAAYADPANRRPSPGVQGVPSRVDGRDPLPRGLARVAQELDATGRASGISQSVATTAQRDQQDMALFHLERGQRFYQAEQDREAMAELQRAVFLSPYEAEAHLLIGRIHLRGGRPREAVDALKISIWSKETVSARIALGEAYLRLKDTAAARAQAQRALAMDPGSEDARALLQKIGG
jgi:tetratricopeptide (TPR) repeat protein